MQDGKRLRRAAFLAPVLICAVALGGAPALAGKIVENEKKLYSFANEELIIRDFFDDRRGGVFLDVGAFHFRMVSSTYYLEEHLGWSGIAVDALAEFAIGYIEHRPRTRFYNFLVTDRSWEVDKLYRVPGAHKGLSTTSTGWLDSWRATFGKWFPDAEEAIEKRQTIYLMTITLNDLLDKNGITEIDFLSMNIEGGEPKALAGFDIERFKPELVLVECLGNRQELLDYFAAHGYELLTGYEKWAHKKNCYFIPAR